MAKHADALPQNKGTFMKQGTKFVYELDGNLYVNLTNRCSNACTFCVRNGKDDYFGHELWLEREPSAEEVIQLIGDPKRYRQIVFCGFGEPTYRLPQLVEIGKAVKAKGGYVRLNTNGQASLIHGQNVAPLLCGAVDFVNVSMNAQTPAAYQAVCNSVFGEDAFFAMIDFAKEVKKAGIEVCFSVVDVIGKDAVSACRTLAEQAGVPLRVREYIEP
jgi:TatD family-associated radical SAM protein